MSKNMYFPNSNFEGNFNPYVFGKILDNIESWNLIVGYRVIYYEKIY